MRKAIRVLIVIMLICCNVTNSYCQSDSLTYRSIGIGAGNYHYASINEISDPYIFSGENIDFLVYFRSITKKYRFDCSFNYAAINRKPINLTVPDQYRLINRDDGHIYNILPIPTLKETQNINLTFELYRVYQQLLFKNDYLGIGATEKTSAILTKGTDNPELVSSSLNPGMVYHILLKHNFNFQIKSYFSVLSIYVRRPYASVEANLTINERSDFEFIKDHLKLGSLDDYFEVFSEFELSKKLSRHFDIQLDYSFIYLSVKSPRRLSGVTNVLNTGVAYKF